MGVLSGLFGGLMDGKPGMFSQLDGSNALERILQSVTGSQPAQPHGPAPEPAAPMEQPMQQPPQGMIGRAAPRRKAGFMDYLLRGMDAGKDIDREEGVKTFLANDPQAMAVYQATGPQGLAAYLNDKRDRSKPSIYSTGDGIVSVSPKEGGGWTTENIYQPKPDAPKAAPGWQVNPDGSWAPVKNGPYDPDYIARTAGVRRDAVVSRPTPRVGGGGRGRSGGRAAPPPLPPGFVMEK